MKQNYNNDFHAFTGSNALKSAEVIVPIINSLLNPKSAVDVGCGTGAWLHVFEKHGVKRILGIDSSYIDKGLLMIREDDFLSADLTRPLNLSTRFDLAVCLEVAEHLPHHCAPDLVRSLASLSQVIVFSAAYPGQGGTNHINERWPGYWEGLFAENGYRVTDPIRPLVWQNDKVAWWYKCNVFVYLHEDLLNENPIFERLVQDYSDNQVTLVHKDVLKRLDSPLKIAKSFAKEILRQVV